MAECRDWGLIGFGNIGQELARQVANPEVAERLGLAVLPSFVLRKSGIMAPDGVTPTSLEYLGDIDDFPGATFVTIPSEDDGRVANGYITNILDRGQIAVTAEKGAMANNFKALEEASDGFRRLGFNATVGGGTRLIAQAAEYCRDPKNVTQLHLALNGTLTAIMGSIAPPAGIGMSLGQAVEQALKLGYAEPGAESPSDVLRSEAAGDIPKKTAIFFNAMGLSGDVLDWRNLTVELSSTDIDKVIEEARVRRFIVSIYPPSFARKHGGNSDNIIGGFDYVHSDGWQIVAGFQHTDRNPLLAPLAQMTGPENGFVIGLGPDETDGVYRLSGPGAGPRPTVNTMLDDYRYLDGLRANK